MERNWDQIELEYQLIIGQQVTGVFLEAGKFIQGKMFEFPQTGIFKDNIIIFSLNSFFFSFHL